MGWITERRMIIDPDVLRTEAKFIADRPELYYQGHWFTVAKPLDEEQYFTIDTIECGSRCCVAGGIALNAGWEITVPPNGEWGLYCHREGERHGLEIKEAAALELLGEQAEVGHPDQAQYWEARHGLQVMFDSTWASVVYANGGAKAVASILEEIADAPDLAHQVAIIERYAEGAQEDERDG